MSIAMLEMLNKKTGDISAADILDFLTEGGYSHVLEYDGERYAYIEDEDDDTGQKRVPVAAVRWLIAHKQISVWRVMLHGKTYRPTAWVHQWKQQHRRSDGLHV